MSMFDVTIMATATRMVDDQTGALEEIKSTFIVEGPNALAASKDCVEGFTTRYNREPGGNPVGCADLDDFEIIMISVVPHDEKAGS